MPEEMRRRISSQSQTGSLQWQTLWVGRMSTFKRHHLGMLAKITYQMILCSNNAVCLIGLQVKTLPQSHPTAPWYDASCRDAKANTRRLERFYRTSRTPAALAAWRMQSRYLRKFLQERYKEYWTETIIANIGNSKTLWSKFSRLLNEVPTVATTHHTAAAY